MAAILSHRRWVNFIIHLHFEIRVLSVSHLMGLATNWGQFQVTINWTSDTAKHIDGFVQERHNSSALAMELCLSRTYPSIWPTSIFFLKYISGTWSQPMRQDLTSVTIFSHWLRPCWAMGNKPNVFQWSKNLTSFFCQHSFGKRFVNEYDRRPCQNQSWHWSLLLRGQLTIPQHWLR